MKTRTLLLLALGCGVAIMLAGAVFLFQLVTQDEVAAPIPIGQPTRVGDMDVTVVEATETGGVLVVRIGIGGTEDDDPADEFRLIAAARPVPLDSSTCFASDGAGQSCDLRFEVGDVDGVSRVLFYQRGEDQARWVLD